MTRREAMTLPLKPFGAASRDVPLDKGGMVLGGITRPIDRALLDALAAIERDAPFRRLVTPVYRCLWQAEMTEKPGFLPIVGVDPQPPAES